MQVGRWYVAVLVLAVAGLAAFLLAWRGNQAPPRPLSNRQLAVLETQALSRLRFPPRFLAVTRGCMARHCYIVGQSSARVAAELPELLRAAGFQPPGQLRAAEPVGMLSQAHWSTKSRDPLVIACKTTLVPGKGPMTQCQDAGRIGETLVNVLVTPLQPCSSRACADPRRAEVETWAVAYPTSA